MSTDNTNAKKPRKSRKKGCLILLALPFVLIVLLLIALQLPPVQGMIGNTVAGAVDSATGYKVELTGLRGTIPVSLRLDSLQLADEEGTFLTVEDVRFAWSPLALLSGAVHVDALTIAKVDLPRLPVAAEEEEAPAAEPFQVPEMPALPTWLTVDELRADSIVLGEDVVPDGAVLSVDGAITQAASNWTTNLSVSRAGQEAPLLALNLTDDNGLPIIALNLRDEALLPEMAGLSAPVTAELNGSGPAEAWLLKGTAGAGDSELLTLNAQNNLTNGTASTGSLTANLAAQGLPEAAADYLGDAAEATWDLTVSPTGMLSITALNFSGSDWSLDLAGGVGLEDSTLDVATNLQYTRAEVLSQLLGEASQELTLDAKATGTFSEPVIDLTLMSDQETVLASRLNLGTNEALKLAGDLTLTLPAKLLPEQAQALAGEPIHIAADLSYAEDALRITKLTLAGAGIDLSSAGVFDTGTQQADLKTTLAVQDLEPLAAIANVQASGALNGTINVTRDGDATAITTDLTLDQGRYDTIHFPQAVLQARATQPGWPDTWPEDMPLDATLTVTDLQQGEQLIGTVEVTLNTLLASLERIEVDKASATAPGLTLTAAGTLFPQTPGGELQGNLTITDLTPAARLAGLEAEGQGAFDFTLGQEGGDTTFSLSGEANQLAGLPAAAQGVLGSGFTLHGEGGLSDGVASFSTLRFVAENAEVSGSGTYGLEDQAVSGTASVRVPNLAPLSELAGRDLTGSLDANAEISGALPNATVTLTAKGTDVAADPVVIPALDLTAEATGVPETLAATFTLNLADGSRTLEARGETKLTEETLVLAPLTLSAGDNTVEAETRVNLADASAEGTVSAAFTNLAYIGNLLSYPLSGTANLDADFNTHPVNGFVRANGGFNNIQADTITLGQGELSADLTGAPTALNGQVTLQASNLDTDAVQADTLSLKLDGGQERADFSLALTGQALDQQTLSVNSAGVVALGDGTATLRSLEAQLADAGLMLAQPATVTWGPEGARIDQLEATLADGTIRFSGGLEGEQLTLTGDWSNLPLSLARLAGAPAYDGTLSGNLDLGGTLASPQGSLNATAEGIRAPDGPPDLTMRVTTQASLSPTQVDTTTELQIADAGRMDLKATLPLQATDDAPPALPANATVNGSLTGDLDLARTVKVLAIKGHEVSGALNADLRFDGPLEQPLFDGTVTIQNGYYENLDYGTLLADLNTTLEAEGKELRIASFAAKDTVGGSIDAQGKILLDAEQSLPFDFSTKLNTMRLVYRDDMAATVGGDLSVAGDLDRMDVKGDLTVGPARYVLPDRLPPSSMQEVHVVEVNGPQANVETPEEEEDQAGSEIHLDVKVNAPNRVFITAPVLDSEWQGNLHVTGTAATPKVEGILRVSRGYLDLLGRRFDLENSSIAFDGSENIDPYLDWGATAQTNELEGTLRITGTMDNLGFDLTSEPARPDDEVLAQLLFGRSLDEITPLQAIQLARVARMLSGSARGAGLFSGGLAAGAVDRFDLRSGENPGEAVVSVGKYLTEDVYAEIEQGVGAESSKVRMNVEFSPSFSGEAETGTSGTGVGIYYKKRY